MAMDVGRLKAALAPDIENRIRSALLNNDQTPYPNLTAFSNELAQSIAQQVISEITNFAVVSGHATGTLTGTINLVGNTCSIVLESGNNEIAGGVS